MVEVIKDKNGGRLGQIEPDSGRKLRAKDRMGKTIGYYDPSTGKTTDALGGTLVGLMYWAVHFIEGTFITPYVQDAEVDLPPVLTMYSTVIFAALFGASGIFLASPLALLVIVAIQVFYLKTPPVPIVPLNARSEAA